MFQGLQPDKRQRIIDAALQEFAREGFNRASTNRIVKAAGIGKGMLFYYFGSKQGLFEYLLDYCMDITKAHFLPRIGAETDDFLARYSAISRIKYALYIENPDLLSFFATVIAQADEHAIPKEKQDKLDALRGQAEQMFYESVDLTWFRSDIKPETAMTYIRWLMDGYERQLLDGLGPNPLGDDAERYWVAYDAFLEDLRQLFYKESLRTV